MNDSAQAREHHVWCNEFLWRPRAGCAMCDRLFRDYPPGDLPEDDLMAKHFPQNIKHA